MLLVYGRENGLLDCLFEALVDGPELIKYVIFKVKFTFEETVLCCEHLYRGNRALEEDQNKPVVLKSEWNGAQDVVSYSRRILLDLGIFILLLCF